MSDKKKTETKPEKKNIGVFVRDDNRLAIEDIKKRGGVFSMDSMPTDLKNALAERDQHKK